MSRYRIDFAYDGSNFRGFARQPDQRTVQGVLEDALRRLVDGEPTVTVAGRTDAGVHAAFQTVHFDAGSPLTDLDRVRGALAKMCAPDIAVWSVAAVPHTFDARFSATERRYRYLLSDADAMHPLWRHAVWHVGPPSLDAAAMEAGGGHLLGEHDFTSFCRRSGDQHLRRRVDRLTVRRIDVAGISRCGDALVEVRVAGPAFCHQMVRSIVGCLLPVGRGTRQPDQVAGILAARDRAGVGRVAPPHGLTLLGVTYAD